ncbi:hypothetical protein DKX38_017429 [Salix brachista]|uniref:Uncharacterized protein n=1 Tax=Salix brachista TaxID=2182728 RepID=A0A5N5KV73_9ROSI|nr:hypothetical protein DKX38_017429 [Salix brachista]
MVAVIWYCGWTVIVKEKIYALKEEEEKPSSGPQQTAIKTPKNTKSQPRQQQITTIGLNLNLRTQTIMILDLTMPKVRFDFNVDCGLLSPTDLKFLMEICWRCHIFMDSLPLPLSVKDAQVAQVDAGANQGMLFSLCTCPKWVCVILLF